MSHSFNYVIGVDEAGRGPLAGPLYVGAVGVRDDFYNSPDFKKFTNQVRDSKSLSSVGREEWFGKIKKLHDRDILIYSYSRITSSSIDKKGITKSTKLGVKKSLSKLSGIKKDSKIYLDGLLKAPKYYKRQETVIKGDETISLIALASIVAKVKRDKHMRRQSTKFPGYGFDRHMGYATSFHFQAIKSKGLCRIHRRTYCQKLLDSLN